MYVVLFVTVVEICEKCIKEEPCLSFWAMYGYIEVEYGKQTHFMVVFPMVVLK